MPSRKFFAVCTKVQRKRSLLPASSEDSADEEFIPRSLKRVKGTPRRSDMETLLDSIKDVKSTVDGLMEVNQNCRIPLGLKKALLESFKCAICLNLAKSPIVVTKCCKNILGCSGCVNMLYSGEDALTKSCPLCRTERGYSDTMVLNGLDSFLSLVNKIDNIEDIPS